MNFEMCCVRSQNERGKSSQLRSNTDTLINSVASMVWDNWSNTNNSLNKRTGEMSEAKNNIQLHLHKTQQEIFDIERNIDLLRKAIQDKANPLKVAQTRLEARGHRAGIEQCKYVMNIFQSNFIALIYTVLSDSQGLCSCSACTRSSGYSTCCRYIT